MAFKEWRKNANVAREREREVRTNERNGAAVMVRERWR